MKFTKTTTLGIGTSRKILATFDREALAEMMFEFGVFPVNTAKSELIDRLACEHLNFTITVEKGE